MIAANFPSLKDEPDTVEAFLNDVGLKAQLFEFVAEAVCEVVHEEDPNADIADLVLGIRNNAAFRTMVRNGAEYGVFQHRSKGGKACITNSDKALMIMVHNTDAATGLGAHAPKFMSKRSRPGTSYVHSEEQGELDLGSEVIEHELASSTDPQIQTKIDVCIFAEKVEGIPICRIELLVDAEMNERGNEFTCCRRRFGMKFRADDFVASSVTYGAEIEDFDELIKPRNGT
ncbi:MAG: hypothetical protein AAGM21_16505 [Pseudomonadota bacterium]